jgi:hypothetical protein
VAVAEAAVTAAEAIAVADFEEAKSLAAEFEALGGGALTMALAQEAQPEDPLRECWLAHERLRMSEARSINRAEILNHRNTATTKKIDFKNSHMTSGGASTIVKNPEGTS